MQCNSRVLQRLIAQGALLAAACGGGDLVLPGDGQPAVITADRGNDQTGTVGAPLADSIVVRVADGQGRPLTGLSVEFVIPPGGPGGQVNPGTALTGTDGRAGAEWVLGGVAGSQVADARVAGSDQAGVRFTATAQAAPAHTIAAMSGNGQSATVGTALPDSLVARVTDQFGNPVSGVPVEWTADPGIISPASVQTDADGRAAARLILGSSAGTQTAAASASALDGSPVIFTQTGMPGSAASLVLVSGNGQSGERGTELPQPLVVRLVDAEGNGMPGQPVTWVPGIGGGSLSPSTGETDAEGLASTRWTLGPSQGQNTANAVASGVGVVTFTANATGGGGGGGGGGGADHLVFRVQPSDAKQDEHIRPPVVVAVVDRNGDVVQSAKVKIKLELAEGSGKLEGKRDRDTQGGLAEFDDLKLSKPGDKVLRAFAPDDDHLGSVQSRSFRIFED